MLAIHIQGGGLVESTSTCIKDLQQIVLRFGRQVDLANFLLIQMQQALATACFDATIQFPKPILQASLCRFTHSCSLPVERVCLCNVACM